MSRRNVLITFAGLACAVLLIVNITVARQQNTKIDGQQVFRFDTFGDPAIEVLA
jgi:hypothetical protein